MQMLYIVRLTVSMTYRSFHIIRLNNWAVDEWQSWADSSLSERCQLSVLRLSTERSSATVRKIWNSNSSKNLNLNFKWTSNNIKLVWTGSVLCLWVCLLVCYGDFTILSYLTLKILFFPCGWCRCIKHELWSMLETWWVSRGDLLLKIRRCWSYRITIINMDNLWNLLPRRLNFPIQKRRTS